MLILGNTIPIQTGAFRLVLYWSILYCKCLWSKKEEELIALFLRLDFFLLFPWLQTICLMVYQLSTVNSQCQQNVWLKRKIMFCLMKWWSWKFAIYCYYTAMTQRAAKISFYCLTVFPTLRSWDSDDSSKQFICSPASTTHSLLIIQQCSKAGISLINTHALLRK